MKRKASFWGLTLATVVVAITTFSAGIWQLSRAAEKNAMQQQIAQKNELGFLTSNDLLATKNIASLVARDAHLQGQWMPQYTVFLDNRQMHDRVGFFVVTPLQLAPQGPVLLVQRGFVQRDFEHRKDLPTLHEATGTVTISGRLAARPGKLFVPPSLFGSKQADDGPIRQNIDWDDMQRQVGLPVLPVILLQSGSDADGLLRDWPQPSVGVETNYGYAAQWFALCALVIGLFVWFQFIVPHVRNSPSS